MSDHLTYLRPGYTAMLEGGDLHRCYRIVGVGPDQFGRTWVSGVTVDAPKIFETRLAEDFACLTSLP